MCICELVRVCVWPLNFLWCSNTFIIYGSKKPQKTDFLPKWFRSHTETQTETEKSLLLAMESLHVRTGRVKASFLQVNMIGCMNGAEKQNPHQRLCSLARSFQMWESLRKHSTEVCHFLTRSHIQTQKHTRLAQTAEILLVFELDSFYVS